MSPRSKREYIEAIYLRYKQASRKEKSIILNKFCMNCGYHRKHAIRVLNNFGHFTEPKSQRRGKPSVYANVSVVEALEHIWLATNLPCSKRLKVILPLWLPFYTKEFGELPLGVVKALLKISPSSIDRLLKPMRIKYKRRGELLDSSLVNKK